MLLNELITLDSFIFYRIVTKILVAENWSLSLNDHPTLKKVKLTVSTSTFVPRNFKIKQLEEVHFHCRGQFTTNDWEIFTINNPNIKSLTIDDTPLNTEGLEHIVNNLRNLEEFTIKYNIVFGGSKMLYGHLRLILENCKNIKKLDMVLNEEPGHDPLFDDFAEKLKAIKFEPKYACQIRRIGKRRKSYFY